MPNNRSPSTADGTAITLRIDRQKESFRLAFSLPEMSWLAGILGFIRLNLPVPLPRLKDSQIREAQESLAERNLIQRMPGAGWQVDRLAAFLVHWLGEAERGAFLEIHRRGLELKKASLYQLKELFLMATCHPSDLEFILFSNEKKVWEEWTRRLGVAAGEAGKDVYRFSESIPLIELAWRNPEAARRALSIAGIPKTAGSSTLAWIDSLRTAVLIAPFPAPPDSKPLILCSDGKSAWMKSAGNNEKKEKPDEFHPCSWNEAAVQIKKFL
jgi:hypothetical protein